MRSATELGRKEKKGKSDRVGERVKCFNYWTVMQHSGYESYLLINIEIKKYCKLRKSKQRKNTDGLVEFNHFNVLRRAHTTSDR